jgi:flagellar M-ring protein FliF
VHAADYRHGKFTKRKLLMGGLLAGLRALGPTKLAALAAVALLSLAMIAFMALRDASAPMALLYADLDLREAGQVVEQLDRARIPHATEAGGARIMVPADQVARARMLLAKDGLPSGGSIGYEIFDRTEGLTASAFQQGISQTRAMEGELARTIRTLQGVRAARVHLVLPKREPFARDRQDAQASVVLTMTGVARLDRDGVQAVLNLIAAAVPGLKPQNIAIVDSRGTLLARAGQPTAGLAAAQTGEELKRGTEQRISRAVEEMLERSLGAGRVRAEATVELDFDRVQETQEKYDPDGQGVRSQQSSTGNSKSTEAPQNVSVQNNLPNAEPSASGAGSTDQKSEETTNYEIGKTVRTVVREQPQMKRLSVAVMVDGVTSTGPDGKPAWAPRGEEELARIANLVRSAVGFDEKRGDRVEIVPMRFTMPDEAAEPVAVPVWAQLDKADLMRLAEAAMLAVAVVAALALVFRPMVLRLVLKPQAALAGAASSLDGPAGAQASLTGTGPGSGTGEPALDADGNPLPPSASGSEAMIKLAHVEGELRAASIQQVTELVERHPEASLMMLRGWILSEGEQ